MTSNEELEALTILLDAIMSDATKKRFAELMDGWDGRDKEIIYLS